jgi:hypothetical protein
VILSRSPDHPRAGEPITVTILIDHPRAAEVRVDPPPFPSGLTVDRMKVEPRTVAGTASGGDRWTAAEFVFSAAAGEYRIGSFRVLAGSRSAATAPLSIAVIGDAPGKPTATLSWKGAPAAFTVGEPAVLTLALAGAAMESSVRPTFAAPENSIFAELPVSAQELRSGVVAKFRVILLDAAPFRLPSVSIFLPDGSLAVARSFPVPVVANAAASVRTAAADSGKPIRDAASSKPAPSFPEAAFPGIARPWLEADYAAAKTHWERLDYVSALAVLRSAERDNTFGFAVRPVRAAAEGLLGLEQSSDERWAPFKVLLILVFFFSVLAVLVGLSVALEFLRLRGVTSARRRRFIIACAATIAAVLCAWRLAYASMDAGDAVVVSSSRARRVPDLESAVSAEFPEGQVGRVRARTGEDGWLFIELPDGRSGWIEAVHARRY